MSRVELSVDGMGSRDCVRAVTALLRDLPGVESIEADGATTTLVVQGPVTERAVRAVLQEAGFPAAPS
jgi:copper chaperone CopZ